MGKRRVIFPLPLAAPCYVCALRSLRILYYERVMTETHDSDRPGRSPGSGSAWKEGSSDPGESLSSAHDRPQVQPGQGRVTNRMRVFLRLLQYRLQHPLETVLEFLVTRVPYRIFEWIAVLAPPASKGPQITWPGSDGNRSDALMATRPVVLLLASNEERSKRDDDSAVDTSLLASGWRVIDVVLSPGRSRPGLSPQPENGSEVLDVPIHRGWRPGGGPLERRELGAVARSIIAVVNREHLAIGAIVCTSPFWLDVGHILRAVLGWPLAAVPAGDPEGAAGVTAASNRQPDLVMSPAFEVQSGHGLQTEPSPPVSGEGAPDLGEQLRALFPKVTIVATNGDENDSLRRQIERRTRYPNFEITTLTDAAAWKGGSVAHTDEGLPNGSGGPGKLLCFVKGPLVLGPGWLCSLVEGMAADTTAGVVTAASNDGIPRIRARGRYKDLTTFNRWVTRHVRRQPLQPRFVPWAPLACLLVRQELFERLDGFDPHLADGAFCELDFARRVQRAGYGVACAPAAYVHVPSGRHRPAGIGCTADRERCEEAQLLYREKWKKGRERGASRPRVDEQAVYDSANVGPPMVAELHQLLKYRDLVHLLTESNIKSRYKRSVLGVFWTLLNPLLHMTVLTLAFAAIFKSSVAHYPVYVLSGLLVWTFFSQVTSASMTAVMSGGSLMRQIYVPPSVFCVATVTAGLVNFVLSLIPLALIMVILGHPFRPALVFVPVAVLFLTVFNLGLSFVLGTLSVFFTDLVEVYGVLLRAGYFLTAVMYPITVIPERWRWVIKVNPVYSYIRCFRDPIYNGAFPPWSAILVAVGSAFVALVLGWWFLARKAHEVVYRT